MVDMQRQLVAEFSQAFGVEGEDLWERLVREEVDECKDALTHLLKEVSDLRYVLAGFKNSGSDGERIADLEDDLYSLFGLIDCGIPQDVSDEAFQRIHESNMSKLDPTTGQPVYRKDGKVLKGDGYRAPDLSDLV